jgi:hypothetical protein
MMTEYGEALELGGFKEDAEVSEFVDSIKARARSLLERLEDAYASSDYLDLLVLADTSGLTMRQIEDYFAYRRSFRVI